jgi:catechol 2,3-dioxygenase-like lactoylglutathione lyase family enzyme
LGVSLRPSAIMPPSSPPLVNVVTLGALDVERLKNFYVALGWPLIVDGEIKLFELRGGVLALFPVESLARDARAEPEQRRGGIRSALEVLVDDKNLVDDLAERVRLAGGRITKPPEDAEFFTGRSCYFADPEDNFFEIAWAPPDNIVVAAAHRAATAAANAMHHGRGRGAAGSPASS